MWALVGPGHIMHRSNGGGRGHCGEVLGGVPVCKGFREWEGGWGLKSGIKTKKTV